MLLRSSCSRRSARGVSVFLHTIMTSTDASPSPASMSLDAHLLSAEAEKIRRSRCHYEVLGIDSNASSGEIRSAYRERAKKHHPDVTVDRHGACEREHAPVSLSSAARHKTTDPCTRYAANKTFGKLNEAKNVLLDAIKRAEYDRDHGYAPSDCAEVPRGFGARAPPARFYTPNPYKTASARAVDREQRTAYSTVRSGRSTDNLKRPVSELNRPVKPLWPTLILWTIVPVGIGSIFYV